MRVIIEGPPEPGAPRAPLIRRLGWFVLLAAGASAATMAAAYLLRTPFLVLR